MDRENLAALAFQGRILITGDVQVVTGLHVGGSAGALAIGNVDQPVVRNPLNGQPYLPGSSIRGKMRSLAEKFEQRPQNQSIGQGVKIHVCQNGNDYATCSVCQVFGVMGNLGFNGPTRLLVRDVALSPETVRHLDGLQTDLPYTEVKWEAAIDRITAAATPRQQERVPAGSVFSPLDLVYSVYNSADLERISFVIQALRWVEDDYLGGQGSRGSGKVRFTNLRLALRARANYARESPWESDGADTTDSLLARSAELETWLRSQLASS